MNTLQKDKITELKWKLIGIFGKGIIDFLFRTTQIELINHDKIAPLVSSKKLIFAFWHSRILLLSYFYEGIDAAILVSPSEDGEIIARILQRQGHETIRGSSTRGGLRAMATLIKCLKQRVRPGVVVPDGPRGPRFKAQPGVITLAKKTGHTILPLTYSAKKIKVFPSWDRFILPYPFTKCRMVYGNPIDVPKDANRDEEEKYRIRLEQELCRITRMADLSFGHEID